MMINMISFTQLENQDPFEHLPETAEPATDEFSQLLAAFTPVPVAAEAPAPATVEAPAPATVETPAATAGSSSVPLIGKPPVSSAAQSSVPVLTESSVPVSARSSVPVLTQWPVLAAANRPASPFSLLRREATAPLADPPARPDRAAFEGRDTISELNNNAGLKSGIAGLIPETKETEKDFLFEPEAAEKPIGINPGTASETEKIKFFVKADEHPGVPRENTEKTFQMPDLKLAKDAAEVQILPVPRQSVALGPGRFAVEVPQIPLGTGQPQMSSQENILSFPARLFRTAAESSEKAEVETPQATGAASVDAAEVGGVVENETAAGAWNRLVRFLRSEVDVHPVRPVTEFKVNDVHSETAENPAPRIFDGLSSVAAATTDFAAPALHGGGQTVFEQIAARLRDELKSLAGKFERLGSLEIRLQPAVLGTVGVKFTRTEAGDLSAALKTDSEAAHRALSAGLDALRQMLGSDGPAVEPAPAAPQDAARVVLPPQEDKKTFSILSVVKETAPPTIAQEQPVAGPRTENSTLFISAEELSGLTGGASVKSFDITELKTPSEIVNGLSQNDTTAEADRQLFHGGLEQIEIKNTTVKEPATVREPATGQPQETSKIAAAIQTAQFSPAAEKAAQISANLATKPHSRSNIPTGAPPRNINDTIDSPQPFHGGLEQNETKTPEVKIGNARNETTVPAGKFNFLSQTMRSELDIQPVKPVFTNKINRQTAETFESPILPTAAGLNLSAAGNARFAVPDAPVENSAIFDQTLSRLREEIAVFAGKTEKASILKMRLHPADLGMVEIRLERTESGSLNASLHTENETARQALSAGLEGLRDVLQNEGWVIERLEVASGLTSSAGSEQRESSSRETEQFENKFADTNSFDNDSVTEDDSTADRLVNLRA